MSETIQFDVEIDLQKVKKSIKLQVLMVDVIGNDLEKIVQIPGQYLKLSTKHTPNSKERKVQNIKLVKTKR